MVFQFPFLRSTLPLAVVQECEISTKVEKGLEEEDFVGVEGFTISDIKSSITTPRLEGYRKKFNFDPSVGLRAPEQGDDPTRPKA